MDIEAEIAEIEAVATQRYTTLQESIRYIEDVIKRKLLDPWPSDYRDTEVAELKDVVATLRSGQHVL